MTTQPQAFTPQDYQAALDALPIARFTDPRVDKFHETIRAALTQCAKQSKNICDECGLAINVCNFMAVASREICKSNFDDLLPMKKETAVREIIEKQYREWVLGETEQCANGCGDGYVMVPAEPTEEMEDAGFNAGHEGPDEGHEYASPYETYKAMIAAYRNQKGD